MRLVMATRDPARWGMPELASQIALGASPRATLGLLSAGRALAVLRGRRFLVPQDVYDVAPEVLRHRLLLTYDALADGRQGRRRRRHGSWRPSRRRGSPPTRTSPAPSDHHGGRRPRQPVAEADRVSDAAAASASAGARRAAGAELPPSPARPVAAKAAVLRRLELDVTRRLDGLLSGDYLAFASGPGTEPAGARPYGPGDDARRIDWSLTARALTPHVRTTEADRELETWVVADRSASLDFGTAEREKREVALAAVAAFGFLTVRAGNRLGVHRRRRRPAGPAAGTNRPRWAARRPVGRSTTRPGTPAGPARRPTSPPPWAGSSGPSSAGARSSSSPTSSTRPTGPRRCAGWPCATR